MKAEYPEGLRELAVSVLLDPLNGATYVALLKARIMIGSKHQYVDRIGLVTAPFD